MQPTYPESFIDIPRRPLDVQDYFDIVRRHKGWIAAPIFLALVIAVVVAFLWPDSYVSSAAIRVVPPQVPQNLVPPNVNVEMSQRINSMYQTVSSRDNLINIITTHNLYPEERQSKPLVDIVEQMRRSIRIGGVAPVMQGDRVIPAFQISFKYRDRYLARNVVQDLVGRFMAENTRERTAQSVSTTQFLEDQLTAARNELEALDSKLADFRQNFQGRLPEQFQNNQMQLSGLEQRISNLNGALARVSQDKMLLEADLRTFKTQRASLVPTRQAAFNRAKAEQLRQIDGEILRLEANLANYRERYKDTYPDVQRILAQLKTANALRERLQTESREELEKANAAAQTLPMDSQMSREARQLDQNIDRIEAQIRAKDAETENHLKQIENVERQIKVVQSRIQASPASEQQYAELIRNRELASMRYQELTRKRSSSAMAEELERRQQGETLELLDPASLPATPTEPNRMVIVGAGGAVGLVIGLMLAGAREAKDNSLKNLKDVRAYTQLSILGSIPLLENALVVRRRKRIVWLAWSSATLVGITIMAGAVFYYYATKT
jgi:polysaccharide chain length determinant protein (PEP-CTERM system associated)